jgi:hypothetical protein
VHRSGMVGLAGTTCRGLSTLSQAEAPLLQVFVPEEGGRKGLLSSEGTRPHH